MKGQPVPDQRLEMELVRESGEDSGHKHTCSTEHEVMSHVLFSGTAEDSVVPGVLHQPPSAGMQVCPPVPSFVQTFGGVLRCPVSCSIVPHLIF